MCWTTVWKRRAIQNCAHLFNLDNQGGKGVKIFIKAKSRGIDSMCSEYYPWEQVVNFLQDCKKITKNLNRWVRTGHISKRINEWINLSELQFDLYLFNKTDFFLFYSNKSNKLVTFQRTRGENLCKLKYPHKMWADSTATPFLAKVLEEIALSLTINGIFKYCVLIVWTS